MLNYKIKITVFFAIVFSMASTSYAQDSITVFAYKKNEATQLDFLTYKTQIGAYEEIILSSKKALKKLQKSPNYVLAPIYVELAIAHYALLNTKKAEAIMNDLASTQSSSPNPEANALALLSSARYYEQTMDMVKFDSLVKKAENLLSNSKNERALAELNWNKLLYAYNVGFYKNALALIPSQELFYTNSISESTKSFIGTDRYYVDAEKEKAFRIRRQLLLSIIKANCIAAIGNYNQADSLLKEKKIWADNANLKNTTIDAELLNARASSLYTRKEYNAASNFFIASYAVPLIQEKELKKITALVNAIENFYRSKNIIQAQSYLRRLQMLAFQSVGKYENFQIAYEYCEAIRLYYETDVRGTEKRLTNIINKYNDVPDNHSLKFKVRVLLSELYEKTGNISALIQNEAIVADIRARFYGENSIVYHKSKINQALIEIKFGKRFKMASDIMHYSYDQVLQKQLEPSSTENIAYLNAYADLYKKMDKLDSSAYRLSLVLEISRKSYGESSGQYMLALANYTDILISSGKYKEGLDYLTNVSALVEKNKVEDAQIQQKIYLVLANLNRLIGEYDLSKKMLDKALTLNYRSNYSDFIIEAEAAEQLATLYIQTNNFYRAEKSLNKAYALKRKNLPEGNPLFYGINNTYASLKLNIGDLASVEQHLTSAEDIANEVYGNNSLMGIESKILYGDYYASISDFKKAEELYASADAVVIQKLGLKHLKHAEILLELISLRSKNPSYKNADIEKLYIEIIEVVKNALGTSNPLYMSIIQRQAAYFISINKLIEAEKLLVEAEKYWKAKLGKDNQYIASIYEMRGDIAYIQSKYSDAESQYVKAKDIFQSVFSENNANYTNVYSKMARVYYMNKNTDRAIDVMDEIIPKYLDFTVKYFPSMSFRQKSKYWNSIKDEFEFYNTLAFNSKKSSSDTWAKAYNNTLATKAILLSSGMKLLNQVMSSEDTVLIGLYNDWIGKKEYLLTILSMSKKQMEEQGINAAQIESDIESIEKQMSVRSNIFTKEEKNKKLVKWEDIKETLIDNEYAVEIIRYRKFDKVFTDSVYYASLVIKRNSSSPAMVLNNNGINMEKRNLKYYRNTTVTHVDDEFSYDVYWRGIKNLIPDLGVVYLSGDGVYNQLNIEMLRHGDGVYAIDENQFVFLSNTKDLLQKDEVVAKKSKKESASDIVLGGGPNFYSLDTKVTHKNVPDLPGAEKEVQLLNDLIVSTGKKPYTFYKTELTEDTIKSLNNPRVIHIATHGYFAESKGIDEDNVATSPLLNSGLMLYASGDILDNPDSKYVNQKSGILTAYEAMNLTLDNTELVVLSACETGRGEIQVGEGVAGLQRSFLLAGSKAVIVSLFKVNDDVTQKLMISFYDKWLKTGDKRKAFSDAKKEIKAQYKEPVYWGAFMMIEGKPSRFGKMN